MSNARLNSGTARGLAVTGNEGTTAILRHAGISVAGETRAGLLGRLHPAGRLDDADFLELLEAVAAVAPQLTADGDEGRKLTAALWDICRTARFWARGRSGPELSLPLADRKRLDVWVDEIERIVLELLHGEPPWWAFLSTAWLCVRQDYGSRSGFLVPIWTRSLLELHADEGDEPAASSPQANDLRALCEALGRSGTEEEAATAALAVLVQTSRFPTVRRAAARALLRIRPLAG
jgi:hypothetical protein